MRRLLRWNLHRPLPHLRVRPPRDAGAVPGMAVDNRDTAKGGIGYWLLVTGYSWGISGLEPTPTRKSFVGSASADAFALAGIRIACG